MGKAKEFWLVKYRRLSLCHYVLYLPPIEPKDHFEVKHVIEKSAYQKAVDALKRIARTRTRSPVAIEYRKIARETLKELGELS